MTGETGGHLAAGSPLDPAAFRRGLLRWYAARARDLPWRGTRDPYAIMVSEFMLQQTQVAAVAPYFLRWMERFPDVASLAAASEEEVLGLWQGLGYYRRAKNLRAAAIAVVRDHGGEIPRSPEALRRLPGLGEYAAAAVAAFAFDAPVAAIDANVARALARLGAIGLPPDSAAGRRALRAFAGELMPRRGAGRFNAALMELGALVCLPRKPRCARCPARAHCRAERPEELPVKKPRRATEWLEEDCLFARKRGAVLLRQERGKRWEGLWKLPPCAPQPGREPRWTTVYPFTHHRVRLRVYDLREAVPPRDAEWVPLARLAAIPVASAHRRALDALLGG